MMIIRMMIINMMIINMMKINMMIINMMILNMASFWMALSSIGGLAATSWMASLSSEFDDFAFSDSPSFQSITTKVS